MAHEHVWTRWFDEVQMDGEPYPDGVEYGQIRECFDCEKIEGRVMPPRNAA